MWLIGGLTVFVLFVIGSFNSLVAAKNGIENTAAGVDAILKKRYDLIPNLVSTVEAYMQHERGLLAELTQLRTRALAATGEERRKMEKTFSKQLGGLLVTAESYPDLKASQNFLQLQAALNEVEEQLSAARRTFNAAVTAYNNALEMFPTNIMAKQMNYQRKAPFEVELVERQNVDVGSLLRR